MADVGIRLSATDNTRPAFDSIGRNLGNLQASAASVAGALASLGVGISVGSIMAMVKQVNDGVDALNDLKDATGASIENISALEDVARRTGSSFDTVSTALIKLNQGLNSAKPGSDTEAAIKAIGLSVKDLKALDPAEAFRLIAVGLSGFADDANKARITQELFGKSLKEVAPLLKDLAEAGQLNATVTTQQAEEAEKFNKQLAIMSKTTLDAARAMTGPLVSAFNETIAKFKEGAKEGKNYYQVLVDEQLRLLGMKDGPKEYAERLNAISRELEGGNIHQSKRNALLREQAAIQAKFGNTAGTDDSSNAVELARLARFAKPTVGGIPDKPKAKATTPTDYQRITDELDKQLTLATAELEVNRKLTEAEKFRVESIDKITDAYVNGKISAEEWIEASAQAVSIADYKQLFEDTQRQIKAELDAAEAHNKYIRSLSEGFDKLQEETAAQEDHIAKLGLSKIAVADLDAAKLESQATIQDLIVLKKIEQGLDQEQYDIYVKTAAELRKQATLRRSGAQREQQIDDAQAVAKAATDEWRRGWEATDQLGREVFASWATDGGNAAQKIGDTLKKALLSAIYEATIKPIAFNLYSSIAGAPPGGAGSVNGLASGVNTASGLNTLWGAGSQFLTGATVGSSTLAMTGANAVGAVGGDALGALIAGNGGWAGVSTAATAGATTAGATAGAAASSTFMTTLATAAPYLLAAVALAALFKKGEYVESTGSSVQYFDTAGATTDKSTLSNNFATTQADAYVSGIKDSYTSIAKSLGATNAGGMFAFAANNSDGGKFGVQVGVGSANYSTGELKATPEAMALEASRAVFAALQGSELPQYLAGVFDGITASTATADQINSVLAYAKNVKTLHDQFDQLPFENLKNLSFAATKGLIELAGGLDALGANLVGYYSSYYSAEEQRAQTIRNITATLNAAGASLTADDVAGATRETFRALVEGQDLTTEAGRKNYTALLSVQGAFAGLTTAAKDASAATNDAAAALAAATAANGYLNGDEGRRIDAAQAVVDGLRSEATQQYIDAQMAVVDAQRNLATVLHTTIKGFEDFLGTLDGARAPTVRLAGARQNFDDITARARTGDTAAIGQLTSSAKTFLDLSKGYSASVQDYRRDEAKVRIVLQQGIAAGQKQLLTLPKEMQAATDPLKDAYDQLTKASQAEFDARTLAIAMQAKLSTAETTLKDKYLDAVSALPNGKYLSDFFALTMKTVEDAAKISTAAALAAQKLLASMYVSGWTDPATQPGVTAPPVTTPAPTSATTANAITAGTGSSTVTNPVQALLDSTAGSPQVIGLSTDPNKYTPGMVGGGTYTNDSGPTRVSITTDGLVRTDGAGGTQLYWARDIGAMLNDYSAANGAAAAISRAAELGVAGSMLDQIRRFTPAASFAVGTNFVPEDMLAQIHKGEAIVPAAYNPAAHTQARDEALVAEIRALRAESAKQQETIETLLDTIATQSSNSAHTLRKLDDIGVKTRT